MKSRKLVVMLVLVALAFGLTTACRWGGNFDDGSPNAVGTNAPAIPGFTPEQIAEIIGVAQSEKANVTLPMTFPAASFYRFDLKNEKGANRLSTILSYQDVLGTPTYGLESTARVILFQALQANLGYAFDYFAFEKTLPKATVDRVVTAMATRFGDVEFLLRSTIPIASAPEVVAVVQELLPGLGKPAPASHTVQLLASGPVEIDLKPRFSMLDNATLMKLIFNDELRALFVKLKTEGLASSAYFTANVPLVPPTSLRQGLRGASRFGDDTFLMGPVTAIAGVEVTPAPLASDGPLSVRLVGTASGTALQVSWPGPAYLVGAWKLEQTSKVLQLKLDDDCSKRKYQLTEIKSYSSKGASLLDGRSAESPTLSVEEARLTAVRGGQSLGAVTVRKGETAYLSLPPGQADPISVSGVISASTAGQAPGMGLADEGMARLKEFIALEKIEAPHSLTDNEGVVHTVDAHFPGSPTLRVTGIPAGPGREIPVWTGEFAVQTTDLAISEIQPKTAPIDLLPVEVTVSGRGFSADLGLRLSRVGCSPIPAASITMATPETLRAQVNLATASPGPWTVELFKTTGETVVAPDLFMIQGPPPTVASISPNQGLGNGLLKNITITGTNFFVGTRAYLTRTGYTRAEASSIVIKDGGTLTCAFDLAGLASGAWSLRVENADGQRCEIPDLFLVTTPRPVVSGWSPPDLPNDGVFEGFTISGAWFTPGLTVRLVRAGFTPIVASVTSVLPAAITCGIDMTRIATGPWTLEVANPDGQTGVGLTNVSVFAPQQTVRSIVPNTGENEGIARGVQISGTAFQPGASVQLVRRGKPPVSAANVQVAGFTSLSCDLDLSGIAIGTWTVSVRNPDGQAATGTGLFTVLPSPTRPAPAVISVQPGSVMNRDRQTGMALTGTGFRSGAAVVLSNPGQAPVSGDAVTVTGPEALTFSFDATGLAVGSWSILVINPDEQSGIGSGLLSVLPAAPLIATLTPAAGSFIGTATVTISGSGFMPGATLTLVKDAVERQATEVRATGWSGLTGVFDLRGLALGAYDIRVTNPDGKATRATDAYRVLGNPPQINTVSPAGAYSGRATTFSLIGSSIQGSATVRLVNGIDTILPRAVEVKSPTSLVFTIDLPRYIVSGGWDLELTNPDGQRVVKAGLIQLIGVNILSNPHISGITPAEGFNDREANVHIDGDDYLVDGLEYFLLMRTGYPIVKAKSTNIPFRNYSAIFDLSGVATGPWQVGARRADGKITTWAGTFMVRMPPPQVKGVSPETPITGGSQLVNLTGYGFSSGMAVRLVRSGKTSIPGTIETVISSASMDCRFNLAGAETAPWDVEVTNPDGLVATLAGGLKVIPATTAYASMTPAMGRNDERALQIVISGAGFKEETRVFLRRGARTVFAQTVVRGGPYALTATFDLLDLSLGAWDLGFEVPGESTLTVTGAFQVKAPPPVLTSVSPATGESGSVPVTVTIVGSRFQTGAAVRLARAGEIAFPASNVVVKSATELSASFSLAGKALGAWDLQVENPDGGLFTLPGAFSILLSAPTITSVGVASGPVAADLAIPISGTGFADGAVVRLMNASLTVAATRVTRTDATLLTAVFPGLALRPGLFDLEVTNPNSAPGIGKGLVTIRDLPPAVSVVTPASGTNDGIVRGLKLIGHSFQDGATFRLTRSGLSPVSATTIAVTLYMPRPYSQYTIQTDSMTGDLDLNGIPTGVWDLEVLNPDGQSVTKAGCFTVRQGQLTRPAPAVTALTPDKGENTGVLQSVQVTGTGFLPWTSARLTRSGYAPVVASGVRMIDATSLVCSFDLTGLAYGNWSLETVNPDGQVGTAATPLFVRLPTLTLTGVTPATGFNNGVLGTVQITGTRFVSGISARLTRAGHASVPAAGLTLTGETTVGCSFDLTGLASGSWKVEAVNPDGQVATWAGVLDVTAVPTVTAAQPSTGLNVDTVNGLQIRGTEFVSGMTVKFLRAGQTAVTATNVTLVNATTLTCSVDLIGLATGAWNIEVTRPGVPAGTGVGLFTVTAPGVPAVGSIAPTQGENTGSINLQVTGSGFASGAVAFLTKAGSAQVSGTGLTLTGTTQLAGTFNLAGLATGAWNVEVMNSGGATGTGSAMLTVRAAPPTVTGVSPVRAFANTVQNNVQVTGTNFFSGLSIRLTRAGSAPIAATNVNRISAGTASCTFDLTGLATGVWNIEVANLDGQTATGANLFTVAPAPWKKNIGGTGAESDLYCIEATDGGFFVAGTTSSGDGDMSGFKGGANDVWIARVNDQGTIVWSKLIGGTGDDRVSGMVAAGTGFALAGSSDSPMGDLWLGSPDSTKRAWAATFDATGNILRLNQFTNPSSSQPSDARGGIRATSDGGFLLAGTVYDGAYWYGWAVKFNSLLQEQWQRRLAANSGMAYAYDVGEKTDNRNVLLCGYTEFGAGSFAGTGWHGGNDGFVFELASETGAIVRGVCLGGTGTDRCTGVVPIPGGGFYVIGTTGSTDGTCPSTHAISDLMLYKMQSDFTIDWAKSVGGSGSETGGRGQLASDGSLLYLGTTTSTDGDCTGAHASGNMFSDYWFGKCSSAGTLQWQRFYGGDNEDDFATGLALTADGGFLLGGYARSDTGDFAGIGHRNANFEFVLIRERTLTMP